MSALRSLISGEIPLAGTAFLGGLLASVWFVLFAPAVSGLTTERNRPAGRILRREPVHSGHEPEPEGVVPWKGACFHRHQVSSGGAANGSRGCAGGVAPRRPEPLSAHFPTGAGENCLGFAEAGEETRGVQDFDVLPNGGVAVLDEVNKRLVLLDKSLRGAFHLLAQQIVDLQRENRGKTHRLIDRHPIEKYADGPSSRCVDTVSHEDHLSGICGVDGVLIIAVAVAVAVGVNVDVPVAVMVWVLVAVGDGPAVEVDVGVSVDVPEEGAVISYILPSMILGSVLLSMPRSTM